MAPTKSERANRNKIANLECRIPNRVRVTGSNPEPKNS